MTAQEAHFLIYDIVYGKIHRPILHERYGGLGPIHPLNLVHTYTMKIKYRIQSGMFK
jgi:hypothetical protein